MPHPFVIGLTGGIGSGKTAASDYFAALGICIVDADLASRAVVAPGEPALDSICEHFGHSLIQADGNLDRAALRKIIFADPSERIWLEQLLHPLIGKHIQTQISQAESIYVILASPLLLETEQSKWVNRILLIDAAEAVQITRTSQRDSSNPEQIAKIMATQMSRTERQQYADDIVLNDGSLQALHKQLADLHETYRAMAAN